MNHIPEHPGKPCTWLNQFLLHTAQLLLGFEGIYNHSMVWTTSVATELWCAAESAPAEILLWSCLIPHQSTWTSNSVSSTDWWHLCRGLFQPYMRMPGIKPEAFCMPSLSFVPPLLSPSIQLPQQSCSNCESWSDFLGVPQTLQWKLGWWKDQITNCPKPWHYSKIR